MSTIYEIRDPIHGFIELNEWEWDIINHPVFQRLRRIRQLGLTDMIYPGAMHTRFEHSLGVMYVATRMFDEIVKRRHEFLKSELHYSDGGLERDRTLVRLASLVHDLGHAPFSHAAEELMAPNPGSEKKYKHEDYSAAAVAHRMKDIIEDHPYNQNYKLKAEEVADFLRGEVGIGRSFLWRNLISGQLDADRADYLLRDSHHIGVAYGQYDLNRIIISLTVAIDPETSSEILAVQEGGEHAAEAMIIARYMMFTQVYFHHTRRAYDYHLIQALKHLLKTYPGGGGEETFPSPDTPENLTAYLAWDDWRVLGMIQGLLAGEHGRIILERHHHRRVHETPEIPDDRDLEMVKEAYQRIAHLGAVVDEAKNSWYRFESSDIRILKRDGRVVPLSSVSTVVNNLKSISQGRIYVPQKNRNEAKRIIDGLLAERERK